MSFTSDAPQIRPPLKLLKLPENHFEAHGIYWRPSDEFLDELACSLHGKRVLECFAGNGYLAAHLKRRGVAITATSTLSTMDGHQYGIFHPIVELDAVESVAQLGPEHDALLLCWPTVTVRAYQCAKLWAHIKNGAPIAYIGEFTDYSVQQLGGCATDEFHEEFVVSHTLETYGGSRMERACIGSMRQELA